MAGFVAVEWVCCIKPMAAFIGVVGIATTLVTKLKELADIMLLVRY
jgi:hypothetical protein